MKNKVRFFVILVRDEDNNIVKDFDMYSFLLAFKEKIDNDVNSVRKGIDGRALRCLPPKNVSKDLKQVVISFGRLKSENLYRENPDMKDMSMVDERIYDMNTVFYSGIHNVAFLTLDKNGPNFRAIAKYLNNFSEYNITITPVIESITTEMIRNIKKFRGFGLELELNDSLMELINRDIRENNESTLLRSLIPAAARRRDELNCFRLSVSFDSDCSKRKAYLDLRTVLSILEEIDIDQDFIKDVYLRGAKNEEAPIKKNSMKKDNYYVEHEFNINPGETFDSNYIRDNGQNVIGLHINEYSTFVDEYFD